VGDPDEPMASQDQYTWGSRKESGPVTQAAFIRSLMASMVKPWSSRTRIGGIFGGSPDGQAGWNGPACSKPRFLSAPGTHSSEQ
jgi:hypothetical protein